MTCFRPFLALALLALTGAADVRSPSEIVAAAPPGAWRAVDPADVVVMRLAGGSRVVLQLAPDLAPIHVENIRALVAAGRFDGGAITRVQDNYVVQWAVRKDGGALRPEGFVDHPPAEYERPATGLRPLWLPVPDSYASHAGFVEGWPVAGDGHSLWPVHCYGMVGVGRDMPPDTGDGTELYAVIGQAPRHLDRNIAIVGRIVAGMDTLSALPRGSGELGFYAGNERPLPIVSAQLASDMPPNGRPHVAVMRQTSASFAQYLTARANRRDAFFVRPAGAVDVCNAPVPVRVTG